MPKPPEEPRDVAAPRPARHQARVEVGRDEARSAVRRAAEAWGGTYRPETGEVYLPLLAGLRTGALAGRVSLAGDGKGTHVTLEEESRDYQLNRGAVGALVLALAGALATFLWPFFPDLTPLAGAGLIVSLAAWFLVLSRLSTNGPEDFLATVVDFSTLTDEAQEASE